MNPILKAFLVPIVRVVEVFLVSGVLSGIALSEVVFWIYSWKIALGVHLLAAYLIAVACCYGKKSDWWPD